MLDLCSMDERKSQGWNIDTCFETVYIHIYLSSFLGVVFFSIYQREVLRERGLKPCSSQDASRSFWEKLSFQRERDELPIEREV